LGDYLGVNAAAGPGTQIRQAANIGSNERVVFSCRGEALEAKFGRSSKLSPRLIVVTNSKIYIIAQLLAGGQIQISVERAIPLGAIQFVGTSTCRDDWFSLGVGSAQEPDPLLNCVFKTELFTQMQRVMPGGFSLKIGEFIEYAKKPNKLQQVKVIKDSQQLEDYYKSGAIHTQTGEPSASESRPMPKAKPVPPRPITRGKLIKPGGPGGRPSRVTANRTVQPRPGASGRTVPQSPAVGPTQTTPPVGTNSRSSLGADKPIPAATRAPPPPPPPAPGRVKVVAKVLYDFNGQRDNELSIRAGDMLEIVQKENNGMWFSNQILLSYN